MKYAYFDPTTSNPHIILGWYYVQDAKDLDGLIYSTLPHSSALADVADVIWSDVIGRTSGAYLVDSTTTPPSVVAAPSPTATEMLTQARSAQIVALTQAYGSAIQQPVSYTSKGGVTKTYQADPGSLSNLQNAILGFQAAGATPSGFYWVSADNTQVPFTFADLQGLAAALLAQGWTAFQRLQTLKAEVAAATSASTVQAVVW